MEVETDCPSPNISVRNNCGSIHPYLLDVIDMIKPNQVWSADIMHVPLLNFTHNSVKSFMCEP